MSISNNRSFFRDDITDGWTKKDWTVNLIPLGGIASVAYEIGSACLSSRDRTAKISRDFFKSPIQTTLKKIAQCLWVPNWRCGPAEVLRLLVLARLAFGKGFCFVVFDLTTLEVKNQDYSM